ncbi:MAG: hypothetical protein LUE11_00645 [Clostridia bacterium]|nr:hypothetical protein [Clostridia bacterium]
MKKVIVSIAAVAMALTMSLSAFALPSPTVSGFVKGVSSAIDKDGTAVDIIVQTVAEAEPDFTAAEKKAIEEIKNEQKLREIMGSYWKNGMKLADIRDVKIKGDASLVTFPVTILFDVPGVTEKSNVAVLHFDTNVGEWEIVDSKAGDATIQAVFNSLSPVAFVVDADTAEAMESTVTSPKTGESGFPICAGVAIVVVLSGAFFWNFRKGNTLSE